MLTLIAAAQRVTPRVDLVTFPLLFLTGFTFASAFLQRFTEVVTAVLKGAKSKGLIDVLLERIASEKQPDR